MNQEDAMKNKCVCVCACEGFREKVGISMCGIDVNLEPAEIIPPRINHRICTSQLAQSPILLGSCQMILSKLIQVLSMDSIQHLRRE
jgi:hypothetical protein